MYQTGKLVEMQSTENNELSDCTEEYKDLINWSEHLDFESYTQ